MKKILFLFIFFFSAQFILAQAPLSTTNSIVVDYETAETLPVFPGGYNAFIKYIGENFKVPDVEEFSGVLKVSFIIEANGKLTNIKVLNDLGHGSADEAVRLLNECPKWKPGTQGGKPIRVSHTIPIALSNH
jgi:hypothetical protein